VDTSVRALEGQDGFGIYADGMQELDWVVGALLGELDQLGIAEDTIVIFTTDNGAERFSRPMGGPPVPRREGPALGGWLPGLVRDPLARAHPAGAGAQRGRATTKPRSTDGLWAKGFGRRDR